MVDQDRAVATIETCSPGDQRHRHERPSCQSSPVLCELGPSLWWLDHNLNILAMHGEAVVPNKRAGATMMGRNKWLVD